MKNSLRILDTVREDGIPGKKAPEWNAQGIEAEQKTVRFFVGAESPVSGGIPGAGNVPEFLKKPFVRLHTGRRIRA
jgi:hypothetical protein